MLSLLHIMTAVMLPNRYVLWHGLIECKGCYYDVSVHVVMIQRIVVLTKYFNTAEGNLICSHLLFMLLELYSKCIELIL